MAQNQRHVSVEKVQVSTAETADGTSAKAPISSTAESLELWVNVTAVDPGDFDFILETSIDGTNFSTQATIAAISVTGVQTVAISRTDDALGTTARVRWVQNSGGATFTIDLVRRE